MGGSYTFWLWSADPGVEDDEEWLTLTEVAFQRPRSVILRDLKMWRDEPAHRKEYEAHKAAQAAREEDS